MKFINYLTEEVSKSDRKKLTSQILTLNKKDKTLKLKSFHIQEMILGLNQNY